jgi:hypothetical protein
MDAFRPMEMIPWRDDSFRGEWLRHFRRFGRKLNMATGDGQAQVVAVELPSRCANESGERLEFGRGDRHVGGGRAAATKPRWDWGQ